MSGLTVRGLIGYGGYGGLAIGDWLWRDCGWVDGVWEGLTVERLRMGGWA